MKSPCVKVCEMDPQHGLCLGCRMFDVLMRFGVIPEGVCAECANVRLRLTPTPRP